MPAADLIAKFGKTVTLIRTDVGAYNGFRYEQGSLTETDIKMSIQPINGRELINLPEGQRARHYAKGYTDTLLYTAGDGDSKKADVIDDGSRVYEVQSVEFWESNANTIVPHYKVLLAELSEKPSWDKKF